MTFPVSGIFHISSGFTDKRPLSNPGKHIHGAVDIAVQKGTEMRSPESGLVYYHFNWRCEKGTRDIYWSDGTWYAFSNYFYDVFGGLIIVEGKQMTHVFAHIEAEVLNDFLNTFRIEQEWYQDERMFAVLNLDNGHPVQEGDTIGYSGNAGFSTGPHIHYEIHNKRRWVRWEKRINPETLFKLGRYT